MHDVHSGESVSRNLIGPDMSEDLEVAKLLSAIALTLGPSAAWPVYPGGYPDEAEAALLDSVFSLSAVYGSRDKGPRGVVKRWRTQVSRPLNSLSQLVADVERLGGPGHLPVVLGNNAVAVPRAKDKPTKAAAVYGAARTLVEFGVDSADDVRAANAKAPIELHRAITRERGIGDAGATYFLMLLGVQGIKADRMVCRFVAHALGLDVVEPAQAGRLTRAAVETLQVAMLSLDYAIWDYESRTSRASRIRRPDGSSPHANRKIATSVPRNP